MKVLACIEYDETASTCTTQAWVEQPSLLPPLSTAEATDIAVGLLTALAAVMAVKVALRKSQ